MTTAVGNFAFNFGENKWLKKEMLYYQWPLLRYKLIIGGENDFSYEDLQFFTNLKEEDIFFI